MSREEWLRGVRDAASSPGELDAKRVLVWARVEAGANWRGIGEARGSDNVIAATLAQPETPLEPVSACSVCTATTVPRQHTSRSTQHME